MTLLAVALTGTAVFFAVGLALGVAPRLSLRARRPRRVGPSARQLWLTQAGVALTPRQFRVGSAALGVATYLLVVAMTATPVVALVPAVSAALLPWVAVARQRVRRLREVQQAWPDGLRELMAGIAAGRSLPQAVLTLAEEGPAPLRSAFERFPTLVRMVGVAPALETIKAELADPTSDRVLEVLLLAHERGGRVIQEILRDVADATTEDLRTLEEIETNALEQKINARAVFVLPWLVLLLLTARPGDFRDFYQSAGGLIVVVVGGALSVFGMWVVGRLGHEPVEARVLVPAEPAQAAEVGT